MIERLTSIVLDTLTVREKDVLVNLFTEEKGRLVLVAKSGRVSRKRFPNVLQPGTYATVFVRKEILEDSEVIDYFSELKEAWEPAVSMLLVMEILSRILPEGKRERTLFTETLCFLRKLKNTERPKELSLSFSVKVLSHLGYLNLSRFCSICGREVDGGARFVPSSFSLVCIGHPVGGVVLSPETLGVVLDGKECGEGKVQRELVFLLKRFFLDYFGFSPGTLDFFQVS